MGPESNPQSLSDSFRDIRLDPLVELDTSNLPQLPDVDELLDYVNFNELSRLAEDLLVESLKSALDFTGETTVKVETNSQKLNFKVSDNKENKSSDMALVQSRKRKLQDTQKSPLICPLKPQHQVSTVIQQPRRKTHSLFKECFHCDKLFSPHHFRVHIAEYRVPERDWPFLCKQCNQRFYCDEDYIEHINSVRNPFTATFQLLYHCGICTNVFANVQEFKRHRRNDHSGQVNLVKCFSCNDQFYDLESRFHHFLKTHEKNWNYSCFVCGCLFPTEQDLNCHKRRCTHDFKIVYIKPA